VTHEEPYSYFVAAAAVVVVVVVVAAVASVVEDRDHVADWCDPVTYRETLVVPVTYRVTWDFVPLDDQVASRVRGQVPWVVVQSSSLAYHHSYQAF